MRFKKLLHSFLFMLTLCTALTSLRAQTSTLVFDYDYSTCYACGDMIIYTTDQRDSFMDSTSASKYVSSLQVKAYLFSCSTDSLELYLNDVKLPSKSIVSKCACSSCDSIIWNVSLAQVHDIYKYGARNVFRIRLRNSNTIYLDRVKVVRTFSNRYDYDAGVTGLDTPALSTCAGSTPIRVEIANFGKRSFSSVDVEWTWNGAAQTGTSYNSKLDSVTASGVSTGVVTLGSKTFSRGKADTLVVWTESPGGQTDSAGDNDTMQFVIKGSYSDTLTVGGSSPDFSTLEDALSAVQSFGICNPTTILLRPGTYTGQYTIGPIPGSDSLNHLTITSSTGDSSDVVLSYTSSTSTANYTMRLQNAANVRVQNLTLEALSTSYGRVIDIVGTLDNVSFSNCLISGPSTYNTSNTRSLVYRYYQISTDKTEDLSFSNCHFSGGSYGMYLYNSYSIPADRLQILNNRFTGQYYNGLYLNYHMNTRIDGNYLSLDGYSDSYGMSMYYSKEGLSVANNRILSSVQSPTLLHIYNHSGTSSKRGLVANNYFSSTSSGVTGYSATIHLRYNYFLDFVHNNILRAQDGTNYAFSNVYGSDNRMYNNIIHCSGTSPAFYNYTDGTPSLSMINYNCYSGNGKVLAHWEGRDVSSLAQLQIANGMDANSVSVDPYYASPTNLTPYGVDLNASGLADSRVHEDISGTVRDSLNPDMGAVEFDLLANDAGIPALDRFLLGSGCYTAVLRNYGADTLKSVSIGWKLNGSSKTGVNWTGALRSGDTAHVCLDTATFGWTPFDIEIWTSAPNSTTDSFPANDTLRVTASPALRGDYTLGGSSPDFVNFDSALAALHRGGVIDSARFLVRDGTYTSQLLFGYIEGADHPGSVIFQGASADSTKAVLEYGSADYYDNYVVKLDNTGGITFRHLNIRNTSSSYRRVIDMEGGIWDVLFDRNLIENLDSTTSSWYSTLVNAYIPGFRNLHFTNNRFENGSYGLYVESDYNAYGQGFRVIGNTFYQQTDYCIYAYALDGFQLTDNYIYSTRPYLNGGIQLYDMSGKCAIEGNQIYLKSEDLYYGIYADYYYDYPNTDTFLVANNMIAVESDEECIGLYLESIYNALVVYNSILNTSTDSSGYGCALYVEEGYNWVYNNNLVHTRNGYALYLEDEDIFKSDYNNFFSNRSKPINFDGSSYSSLAAYQSGEGLDSNSISADPYFTSPTDLHASSALVNNKGVPIAVVLSDIDGEQRDSLKPDIGADEFSPPAKDAAVVAWVSPGVVLKPNTMDYIVRVQNLGLDTINEVSAAGRISTDFSTTSFSAVKSTKTLAPGDTVHIRLGSYTYSKDSVYHFVAWSLNPGGVSDQKPSNDTLSRSDVYPAMAGVYTIGGSSPDFTTIRGAIQALDRSGISDTVTFRIRNGTYPERLDLMNPVAGYFGRHSVIFESESRDSTKVTIQYAASQYDSNWVVYLNGADGITFRDLTIRSSSTGSYGRVFRFENGATMNTIQSCLIQGMLVSNTYTEEYSLVHSGNSTAENGLYILNNRLENGSVAISLYEYPGADDIRVIGNKINCYGYYGVIIQYADSITVADNQVTSNNYSSFCGIYLDRCYNFREVSGNKVVLNRGQRGIYLYECDGSAGGYQGVYNNFISMLDPSNSGMYGIQVYYSDYVDVSYNSVRILNSQSNDALAIFYSNTVRVFNNNIDAGSGIALRLYPGSAMNSNFNNLFTRGSNLCNYNGTNYGSLASWQSTGRDSSSMNLMPEFFSDKDLHTKDIRLYRKGTPLAEVDVDIDGQLRDSVAPYIGAHEYIPPKLDAGIADVITPKMPFLADTQQVVVVLRNYGTDTLKTVSIHGKLNDSTYSPKSWSGVLSLGDTAWVLLGSYVFKRDSAYHFKTWTSSPNPGSGTDAVAENDTMELEDQYPALSGIYTVGGGTPDFNTLEDVLTALSRGGVYDSARFDIRSGTYSEQLEFGPYIGADKKNAIIFQSELMDSSKVWIATPSSTYTNNYTILLDSARGITFRHLTLTTPGTYYSNVIRMNGGTRDICIDRCHILGPNTSYTGSETALILLYAQTRNQELINIEIANSLLRYGSIGLYAYGYYGSGARSSNLSLLNNRIMDQYYMNVYLQYFNTCQIVGNMLKMKGGAYSYAYSLYLYYADRYKIVSNNVLDNSYMGFYLYYCSATSSDSSLIANNMISLLTRNHDQYGIYLYSGNYVNILHNNVSLSSTYASSYGLYLNQYNYRMFNNNFAHSGIGYATYFASSGSAMVNYNNYYSNGTNLIYRSGNYTTFSAYQSASGQDANGLNVDPEYMSSTDLHTRNVDLNGAGKPVLHLVPTDIDGEPRDSIKPDIGADEISIPSADDAGISGSTGPQAPFAPGSNAVYAIIRNFGYDSLKSANIHWSVNGGSPSTYSWTGALRTYEYDTVNLGNYSFSNGVYYQITFWTSSPNGVSDTITYNDTFVRSNLIPGLIGTYTVGGTSPHFATPADAVTALNHAGILGNVIFSVRSGTYNSSVTMIPYQGSSPSFNITFQSATGNASDVIWKATSSGDRIVYINGADRLRFRNLTFRNDAYYSGTPLVEINNSSTNLEFSENVFDMNTTYYYYYYYSNYGIRSNSDNDDSLLVRRNTFNNGYMGIYLYGLSSSNYEKGVRIDSNNFYGQYAYAIYAYQQEGLKIRGNNIQHTVSTIDAVQVSSTSASMDISNNKIIKTTGGTALSIQNHQGGVSSPFQIYNNFLVSTGGGTISNRALYTSYCSHVKIYFNSLHNTHGNSSSAAFIAESNSSMDVRNNIFSNSGTGYAINLYNSSLSQSDYNNFHTSGSQFARYANTDYGNLSSFRSATGKDGHSISVDPNYFSITDLHTGLSSLDSAGTPIAGITVDIDGDTRNTTKPDIGADEFNSLPNDLGVQAIIAPQEGCDMDTVQVKVTLFNYGSLPQTNFPVRYQLNGGIIDSTLVTDTLKRGESYVLEFDSVEVLSANTQYELHVWTDLSAEQYRSNDSMSLVFTNHQKPDSVSSMVPADGTQDVSFPISLSWLPSTGATKYDVYIWDTATSKPATPNYSNLTQISLQITSGLSYGTNYYWQVIAKNIECSTEGYIQKFKTRYLPDLVVTSVNPPTSAFSSTQISINWTVKNRGLGNSGGTWYDRVYLSDDSLLGADTYLGEIQNPSAPNANGSYSNNGTFTLPNGIAGNYRVFVLADERRNLLESNENNNTARDSGTGMVVSLTPPPDLIVSSVIAPADGFSGQPVYITYTVKNDGTGPTRSGQWYDVIYITNDSTVGSGRTPLKTVQRNGDLKVDSTYTQVSTQVNLPNNIEGKRFIIVKTDAYNYEYEYASDGNNEGFDSLKVILTPPPDLVPYDVTHPDTAANLEYIQVGWNTINDGGTSTANGYWDEVYLSPNPVLNISNAFWIGGTYQYPTAPGDTASTRMVNARVPNGINGKYYIFVVSDAGNKIAELSGESNNISAADSIRILSPDLVVRNVQVDNQDTTGQITRVKYWVRNIGNGGDYQGSRYDSIFMHTDSNWSNSAVPIGSYLYTPSLNPGDSVYNEASVQIPDGLDGRRYFFVHADGTQLVFENGNDNNNRGVSDSMTVILAPYPDLIPRLDEYPDSAEAGDLIYLQFNIRNDGDTTAVASWRDVIYLSSDSLWQATDLVLGTSDRTTNLQKGSSYDISHYPSLPSNLIQGTYYFIVRTDVLGHVYEHAADDSNNTFISEGVFMDGYPPIDLVLGCPDISDTLYSGTSYNLTYMVTNKGQAPTASNYWTDVVYLSSDSTYSSNDVPIGTYVRAGNLNMGDSFYVNLTATIPNGLQGDYYVLVRIDTANRNMDIDLSSNVRAACKMGAGHKKVIKLTPPPDLKFTSWTIPSTGTSGQNINIKYTVKNDGTGPTLAGSWVDKIFLSTDYVLDNSDYGLGTYTRSGNLAAGASYQVDENFSIPIDKSGNYIVIIQTDVANVVYEYTKEGNNTASSISTFSLPPPADLIVSQIVAPTSVISGESINIQWKIKNQGTNPAQGSLYENVYLSKDQVADAGDLLLASEYNYISLGQNAELSRSKNYIINGVPLGYYYIIVATDVRNNIYEQSDTNNSLASFSPIYVDVPELILGTVYLDTLSNDEKLYYRFYVPDSLDDESLLITLKGDSANGNNEMYVRYIDLATPSSFDQKHRDPFQGNQEIIVPETDTGTYYLLVTGSANPGNPQAIEILVKKLPFEIRRVSPVSGGKGGEVTLKIEGSKFTEETEFYLGELQYLLNGNPIAEGEFDDYRDWGTEAQIEYYDPTIAFATFPLNELNIGLHDVVAYRPPAEKESATAILEDGFEVTNESVDDIQIQLIHPSSTRRASLITVTVLYTNKGSNDAVNRKITVVSTSGSPIALNAADITKGQTRLEITLEEPGGPPGRLRPDASGSAVFYVYSSGALGFFIQQQ